MIIYNTFTVPHRMLLATYTTIINTNASCRQSKMKLLVNYKVQGKAATKAGPAGPQSAGRWDAMKEATRNKQWWCIKYVFI